MNTASVSQSALMGRNWMTVATASTTGATPISNAQPSPTAPVAATATTTLMIAPVNMATTSSLAFANPVGGACGAGCEEFLANPTLMCGKVVWVVRQKRSSAEA